MFSRVQPRVCDCHQDGAGGAVRGAELPHQAGGGGGLLHWPGGGLLHPGGRCRGDHPDLRPAAPPHLSDRPSGGVSALLPHQARAGGGGGVRGAGEGGVRGGGGLRGVSASPRD